MLAPMLSAGGGLLDDLLLVDAEVAKCFPPQYELQGLFIRR
jgi:hypothetical protein